MHTNGILLYKQFNTHYNLIINVIHCIEFDYIYKKRPVHTSWVVLEQ